MLKIRHTFEVVSGPDARDHLGSRRSSAFAPGKAEQKASAGTGLTEGRVAVRILRAEAELEAGAEIRAPNCEWYSLAIEGRPPRVRAARAGEEG